MRNKDELAGKGERMKGRVKETAGKLTNDERMRNRGAAEEASGQIRETFGKGRRKVGEAIKGAGNSIKR